MYTPTNHHIRKYLQITDTHKNHKRQHYRHGYSRHPLYSKYTNMMHSCYNPNYTTFKLVGAKGIIVCERWHDIDNFFDDVLPLYHAFKANHPNVKLFYLARKHTDKGYYLQNVFFGTRKDINRNNIAKLDQYKVTKIKQLYDQRLHTQRELAKQFDISLAMIGKILRNENWL